MDISQFRDEVGKILNSRGGWSFECVVDREPDELSMEIHDVTGEWSYLFAGPSWVCILAALQAAIANGDLDDPKEKYPEYYEKK